MSNFQDFQERLEHALLFQITLNLKNGRLDPSEAQKIASEYLQIAAKTKEELLQGVINMGHTYTVIQPVIAKFSEEYDEEFRNDVLSLMKSKLEAGNIEEAVEEGKKTGGVHA